MGRLSRQLTYLIPHNRDQARENRIINVDVQQFRRNERNRMNPIRLNLFESIRACFEEVLPKFDLIDDIEDLMTRDNSTIYYCISSHRNILLINDNLK